jgi:hypothetical protein
MMTVWQFFSKRKRERGQSLVETALFLPILIFLIAGVVEVSNLLITQNRITTAARTAAGFGAANFDRDDWSGTAGAMGVVALNTVTETLILDSGLWDIWSIHARTDDTGSGFEVFTATHVFGDNAVVDNGTWAANQADVQADMLSELQSTGASAADLEVVASVTYHAIDTILGLPVWQWTGLQTLRGLTVMRVGERAPYTGCPLLPIAVRLNQYSIYPSNWPEDMQYNPTQYPGDGVEIFPEGNGPQEFDWPVPAPQYINLNTAPSLETATYVNNIPGVPLGDALSGYVYLAREEGPSGGFGWLTWDGDTSAVALGNSLTFPGNFLEKYPGSDSDMGTGAPPPGTESGNQNGVLEIGEWLENSTGNISSMVGIIRGYIDSQTPVTLIMYDETDGETGSNADYRVRGFVIVKLIGYSFQGANEEKWIMFEFVAWGSECIS